MPGLFRRALRAYARGLARAVTPCITGRRVLDLGAGEAFAAEALTRPSLRVCSPDIGPYRDGGEAYAVYDGRRLPFRDGTFDTTLILLTLHHCDDPAAVLGEAARVTRQRLIVMESVYRNALDHYWLELLDERVNRFRHGGQMTPARHVLPVQGWKALVASRGLRLVAESWLGSWWERLVHHPVLLVLDKVGRQ